MRNINVAILGGGNIGSAIANGLVLSKKYKPEQIIITRRRINGLSDLRKRGFKVTTDNQMAVKSAKYVFLTVRPDEIMQLITEIKPFLRFNHHILISVITGVPISTFEEKIGKKIPIVRAMPNTAIAVQESMTCLAFNKKAEPHIKFIKELFDNLGRTKIIPEDDMIAATSLCACGVAFFLRGIRAAAQGGIEIGFHPEDAIFMSAQTALGAAKLLLEFNLHPEQEVDKVTTPRGCTIAGLNQMEHEGFSSAIIQGIKTSAEKAGQLFKRT